MAEPARVWAIRAAEKDRADRFARLFWNEGVAAIDYLGNDGPDILCCTKPQLKDTIRRMRNERGRNSSESRIGNVANQLWRFANEIRKEDWIIIARPKPGDVMIGLCASPYEYAPGRLADDEYPYIIRVDWLKETSRECLSDDLQRSITGKNGQTLFPVEKRHIPELESLCKLGLEYRRVPVNLPNYLVQDVDKLVGERGRPHFIEYLVTRGLEEAAEELSKGEEEFDALINPVTHPEWATSAMVYAWVRASRDLDNERSKENWRDRLSP